MNKKNVHYVDNKEFYNAILEYKKEIARTEELGLDKPRIPEYIGECILKIATNLAIKPCFTNYSYKDEMILDAVENSFLYFDSFNPETGKNPFAYFTQVAYFAFLRRLESEEKNRYMIYKSFVDTVNVDDIPLMSDSDGNAVVSGQLYDNIYDFMKKFEDKQQKKKDKRRAKKEGLEKFYDEKENTQ